MNYSSTPDIKTCEFCGDEFESHHGLQRYCPEKYGRRNYCKNEQKKLVSEHKLAELVQEVATAYNQIENPQNQLEKNIKILEELSGMDNSGIIYSKQLDRRGFDIRHYSFKRINDDSGLIEVIFGTYVLDWISHSEMERTFKVKKI